MFRAGYGCAPISYILSGSNVKGSLSSDGTRLLGDQCHEIALRQKAERLTFGRQLLRL